jgi:digeranylgeranylglycerophospholipid reductase
MTLTSDSFFIQHYDVIIAGGGPAGTTAAQFAAKNGATVILFERDPVIGIPVRCGEGISRRGLRGYVPLNGPWIANKIQQVELIAPDGTAVRLSSSVIGYILDRTKFDKLLGDKAEQAGARIVTEADVVSLIKSDVRITGVVVNYKGQQYEVYGTVIIGADGVEARIGRWAGLDIVTKLENMESSVQIKASNIKVNPRICQFYFGREIAPGGYLWVFPKSDTSANIGVGISGNYSREKSAQYYLLKFVEKYFPDAEWTSVAAGGIPCNPPLRRLTIDNVMVVGDAGHQVNPLTGAGIANALQGGKFAGETAAEALRLRNALGVHLTWYTKRWYRGRGRFHLSSMKLKNFVIEMNDEALNKLAHTMHKTQLQEWSLLKLFLYAVQKRPDLLVDCVKLFGKF